LRIVSEFKSVLGFFCCYYLFILNR
jgi:hypothetical protein